MAERSRLPRPALPLRASDDVLASTRAETALDRTLAALHRPVAAWALVAVVLLSLLTYRPPVDPDVFARVAVGRLIEANGGVVDQDPFAFTPKTERWIDHEWLSGVVLYRVARLGGDSALLAFDLGMMLLTLALLVRAAREHSRERGINVLWLLVVMLPAFGIWVSVVRSRVFSFALLAWMLLMLVRWRHRAWWWICLVPPAFLLWANFHGGFVAGLGLLGIAAVAVTITDQGKSKALWGALAASTLLTLVNPYGLDYWRYILMAVTMERPGIVEWEALSVLSAHGALALVCALVFAAGGLVATRRPPPEAWALAATALLAAFSSQRILNFYWLILAVYGGPPATVLARRVQAWAPRWSAAAGRVATAGALIAVPVLGAVILRNLSQVAREGLGYEALPVEATDWLLRSGGGGRLLVHFNHGSYALWRLYPHYQVSVDGRYEETYPQSTVNLGYDAITPGGPNHEAALVEVDPDYILLPDAAWASRFGPDWERPYADERFAVLARSGLEPGAERPARPTWTPGF